MMCLRSHSREYVASFPADVLAARFVASEPGSLHVRASFSRMENILSNEASASGNVSSLALTGTSGQPEEEDPILFSGQARFMAPGGKANILRFGDSEVLTLM